MWLAPDELAEALRLLGAVLVGVALFQVLQHQRWIVPMRTAAVGTLVLLVGGFGLLIATMAPVAARLDESLFALALEYFEETAHGRLLIAPMLPAVYALIVLEMLRGAQTPRHREVLCWMLGSAVFAIAWLIAVGGHTSMDEDRRIEMIAQVLHVAAALAWVALVLSLVPDWLRGEPAGPTLRRFGNVALAFVIVLGAAGIVTACARGAQIDTLTEDTYGVLLLAKSALFMLALALAAWNRFVALRTTTATAPGAGRVLAIEAGLLLTALLIAATLARTPPPV